MKTSDVITGAILLAIGFALGRASQRQGFDPVRTLQWPAETLPVAGAPKLAVSGWTYLQGGQILTYVTSGVPEPEPPGGRPYQISELYL